MVSQLFKIEISYFLRAVLSSVTQIIFRYFSKLGPKPSVIVSRMKITSFTKEILRPSIEFVRRLLKCYNSDSKSYNNLKKLSQMNILTPPPIGMNLLPTTVYFSIILLQGLLIDCPLGSICRANLPDLNRINQYGVFPAADSFQVDLAGYGTCPKTVIRVGVTYSRIQQYTIEPPTTVGGTDYTLNFNPALMTTTPIPISQFGTLIRGYCTTQNRNQLVFS